MQSLPQIDLQAVANFVPSTATNKSHKAKDSEKHRNKEDTTKASEEKNARKEHHHKRKAEALEGTQDLTGSSAAGNVILKKNPHSFF